MLKVPARDISGDHNPEDSCKWIIRLHESLITNELQMNTNYNEVLMTNEMGFHHKSHWRLYATEFHERRVQWPKAYKGLSILVVL